MEAESFHNPKLLEEVDTSGKEPMNIVFWGEEQDSGTTAHMLAVAGMLAVLCPEKEIVWNHVPRETGGAVRRRNPPQKVGGADVRSRSPRKTGGADVRSCSPQKVGDAQMHKYPSQEAENVIHIYDCGTGLGRRKRHMLWHADLVVVNLRQERTCIEHFFGERFHIAKDMVFLLDARDCEVGADHTYLEQIYRVEREEIGVLPYNNGYYQALLQGNGAAFIRNESRLPENVENERFVRELRRIALLILRKAEEHQSLLAREAEEEQRRQKKTKRGGRKSS